MNGLGEWSALADDYDVSFFHWESRWTVYWDVSMSLLVSVIFRHIVKIVTSDNNGSLHFCGNTDSFQDLASDGDIRGEGAFPIDEFWFDGLFGCLEAQSDVLIETNSSWGLFGEKFFTVQENIFLLLEGSFMLRLEK